MSKNPKNAKEAQKKAQDLTFGMKNKNKSKKVQNYVSQIAKQQEGNARRSGEPTKSKKQLKAEKDAEYAAIFKPVIHANKEAAGVDPKTIICEFFKQGRCTKGNKCKFSHDMSQERKSEKKDVFSDSRDDNGNPELGESVNYLETNADWDEEKLRTVVEAKAVKGNQTEIVCKYFITAIENNQYGWFWDCPNGAACKYRHALPSGYVFKASKKRPGEEDDEEEKETMEEILEKERSAIKGGTPLTLEVFMKWKEEKNRKRDEQQKKSAAERGIVTGRDLFMSNPELAGKDDENAADDAEIHKQATENADEAAQTNAPVTVPTNPEPVGQEEASQTEKEEKKEGGIVIDTSVFTADEELPDDDDL